MASAKVSVLAVPNWSFARERHLGTQFAEIADRSGLRIHYLQGDIDHNRTVTALYGDAETLFSTLLEFAEVAFDVIDLNRHQGVHPRVGALDVCPFVDVDGTDEAKPLAIRLAAELGEGFGVPTFLYEQSETGRHEADLPTLRKGGFGGLLGRVLRPDFGPTEVHPRLGMSVVGARGFLIAMNLDLDDADPKFAKLLASQIRQLRSEGDERFLGVRALGFPLPSRGQSQVSLNLTLPDLTPVDPIVEWVVQQAKGRTTKVANKELIGVIRRRDLAGASHLPVRSMQIVEI